ncbi:MAG: L-iditol 2-dehydrogenase [Thaumarchaeota archaeon]|nr:L-iditol 2-dehydrogenase [Nitrososphaerota archaeon]
MKAVFVKERNQVSVDNVPSPGIGDGDVLVKMKACGLCGSDLEKIYGHYGMVSQRLGHEPAGEIKAVGKNVKDFKVGDRVFVHHHVPCYSCHYCEHEDYTMCQYYQKSNLDPCGLAEIFLVPEWNVSRGGIIKLPDSISFDEAAMIEPLACCIRAINKVNITNNDDIAVIGVGPAGIMHILLAKAFGANRVFALDINDFRLNFAKKMGAELAVNINKEESSIINDLTDGRGVDITIVSTGNTKALLHSLTLTRKGGEVVLFGVPPKDSKIQLDVNHMFLNEIKLIPSLAASEKETNYALELITSKQVDIKSIITHRFSLERTSDAIKCAYDAKDAMKVIITSS